MRGALQWLRPAAALAAALAALAVAAPVAAATPEQRLAVRLSALMRSVGHRSGAWVADSRTGRRLFAWRSGRRRTPASVQKLFTTTAALERLGAKESLRTTVLADGTLTDGTLTGHLYIKGFGDPSFGDAALAGLATQIRDAGVARITGKIYGDESYFDRRRGVPASGFAVSRYIGPLSALSFNQGTRAGGGFQPNPARFVARRLRAALVAAGVRVDRSAGTRSTPDTSIQLAEVRSPPIALLVRRTNRPSNNYFAETLLKGLGARFGRRGSTAEGALVVRAFLRRQGLAARVVDGSGLSRGNAVSPRSVGRLLVKAERRAWFKSFYRSLPLAGRSGTLRKRMRGSAAAGRCRAKTGTLLGVSSLAGYCRSRSGRRIAFALLMNRVNVSRARRAQDRFAATLASYRG